MRHSDRHIVGLESGRFGGNVNREFLWNRDGLDYGGLRHRRGCRQRGSGSVRRQSRLPEDSGGSRRGHGHRDGGRGGKAEFGYRRSARSVGLRRPRPNPGAGRHRRNGDVRKNGRDGVEHHGDGGDERRRGTELRPSNKPDHLRPPFSSQIRMVSTEWRYCLPIAKLSRSSGEMRWSWLSSPMSICTQSMVPVKRLPVGL